MPNKSYANAHAISYAPWLRRKQHCVIHRAHHRARHRARQRAQVCCPNIKWRPWYHLDLVRCHFDENHLDIACRSVFLPSLKFHCISASRSRWKCCRIFSRYSFEGWLLDSDSRRKELAITTYLINNIKNMLTEMKKWDVTSPRVSWASEHWQNHGLHRQTLALL